MYLLFNHTSDQLNFSCFSCSNMDEALEFSDVNFGEEDKDNIEDNIETLQLIRRLSTLEEVR